MMLPNRDDDDDDGSTIEDFMSEDEGKKIRGGLYELLDRLTTSLQMGQMVAAMTGRNDLSSKLMMMGSELEEERDKIAAQGYTIDKDENDDSVPDSLDDLLRR